MKKNLDRRKFVSEFAMTASSLVIGKNVFSSNSKISFKGGSEVKNNTSSIIRKLRSLSVSPLGLGGLPVAGFYGGGIRQQSDVNKLYQEAFDNGISFFDTAEIYASFENEMQVGEAIAPFRKNVVLATKFGFDIDPLTKQNKGVNSRPEHIKLVVEGSLKRLKTDYIDLYYQHRVDPNVPIEDVAGAIQDLIKEGKILHWGLSEPGINTIRRANAVHPLSAIQNEYSIWTRDPEAAVLPLCEELGIGFVPWCPLGYGFFAGAINENTRFAQGDFRAILPRIMPENLSKNLKLLHFIKEWGVRKNATISQISLSWLQSQKPWIVPIPGTSNIIHLKENIQANNINFTKDELKEFNQGLSKIEIAGPRNAKPIMDGMGVESASKK